MNLLSRIIITMDYRSTYLSLTRIARAHTLLTTSHLACAVLRVPLRNTHECYSYLSKVTFHIKKQDYKRVSHSPKSVDRLTTCPLNL